MVFTMATITYGYRLAYKEPDCNLEEEEKISKAYTDFYNGISKNKNEHTHEIKFDHKHEIKQDEIKTPIDFEVKKQEIEQANIFREWLLGEDGENDGIQ